MIPKIASPHTSPPAIPLRPRPCDPRYGTYHLKPFEGKWLNDLPQLVDHLVSEHLLHIRGNDQHGVGTHWTTNKYAWRLNPTFNPQAKASEDAPRGGFQMRIGYFKIPIDLIRSVKTSTLNQEILKDLEVRDEEGELKAYRFFVHPEGYMHYARLHDVGIPFVKPEESTFMGTPTSSYRSWLIRRLSPTIRTTPFIFKMGVASLLHDKRRLLPAEDIFNSHEFQTQLEMRPKNPHFSLFPETMGMILNGFSGAIVRQVPMDLLVGRCKILSYSALMSVERVKPENQGICAILPEERGYSKLPLIYELFESAIEKGVVNNSVEYLRKYLIDGYIQAIEPVVLAGGLSLSPHGQNLCVAIDHRFRYVYRDLKLKDSYLESYTMNYYDNFTKLLNVLVRTQAEYRNPPPGAPTQVGFTSPPKERNLFPYLMQATEGCEKSRQALEKHAITEEQYDALLREFNQKFIKRLNVYFDVEAAKIVQPDGSLPAAEKNSSGAEELRRHNENLWQHRRIRAAL